MGNEERKTISTSMYFTGTDLEVLEMIEKEAANRSAGIRRLFNLVRMAGGLKALEDMIFERVRKN